MENVKIPGRISVIFFLLFAVFSGTAATHAETGVAIDPESLIGEWDGEWYIGAGVGRGNFYLTLKEVKDGVLIGDYSFTGGRPPYNDTIRATLEGQILKVRGSYRTLDLTVSGDEMKGSGVGTVPFLVELKRNKKTK
jgi:hypothetical protein